MSRRSKPLSNDVHKNLEVPLAEIAALAEREGIPFTQVRTAVRTGDTPMPERQRMIKSRRTSSSPRRSRCTFSSQPSGRGKCCEPHRTVIVDEIHAIADDKRGSHLALSLARFDALDR